MHRCLLTAAVAAALSLSALCRAADEDKKAQEAKLISVLKGSAPRAEKEAACRELRLIGSADAVPALAALLGDKDLWEMARFALEPMPYPQAGEAFRQAMGRSTGEVRVAIINSLATRKDAQAVPALSALLGDADKNASAAAAAALGQIATADAADALVKYHAQADEANNEAAAEALLAAAEGLLKAGQSDRAANLLARLNIPDSPRHIRMASFRALALVRPAQAPPMLLEVLGGNDRMMINLAAQIVAELPPGEETVKLLAQKLPSLSSRGQLALVRALAKRSEAAAREAVVLAVKSEDAGVKLAAVTALGQVGTAAEVELLAGLLTSDNADMASQARTSLAAMSGEGVNKAIAAAADKAKAPTARAALVALLGQRQARDCVPAVLKAMGDREELVRLAAVRAVGQLGAENELPQALDALAKAGDAQQSAAEEAVLAIASRAGDKALPALGGAMAKAEPPVRVVLVRALGRIGSDAALPAAKAALADNEADVADEAVRVLAAWPAVQAHPLLLEIARTGAKPAHRILAVRGCIRLAGLEKDPQAQARMLTAVDPLVQRSDEKKLLLSAWGRLNTPAALEYVVRFVDDATVQMEAADAAINIATAIGETNADAARAALKKVLAAVKNEHLRERAEQALAGLK